MNVSSASAAASPLWSLLAARAAQSTAARSATTATTAASESFSTSDGSGGTSGTAVNTSRPPGPPPPPPPPGQFDMSSQSTAQFAGLGGPPPQDPIASLDADDSGSVSADEFGLDGASSDVQALFKAIDSDGSGDLSTDEITSFREQMMAADNGSGDTTTTATPAANAEMDVSAFIQQLAQRYADMAASSQISDTGISAPSNQVSISA